MNERVYYIMKRRIVSILLAAVMTIGLSACGSNADSSTDKDSNATAEEDAAAAENEDSTAEEPAADDTTAEAAELTIAYQPGIIYAPITIMKEQKLIEKHYGGEVSIEWSELYSGAAINEAITAGDIDVAALGVAPAVVGVQAGVPYRIFSSISSVPYGIMTNIKGATSLKDFKEGTDQIALVAQNSYPHIVLAMAAKAELGDAHALDTNLVALSIPDGYSAMVSGTIKGQVASAPYNYLLEEKEGMSTIKVADDVWPEGDSGIIGIAATSLYEDQPKLYEALCAAMQEATDFINNNTDEAAAILAKDYDDVTPEQMAEWLKAPKTVFSTKLQGIMKTAKFMVDEDFTDKVPENFSDLVYDNVKGD
jgi:NitT/TauT family transport system substrate-binding protein